MKLVAVILARADSSRTSSCSAWVSGTVRREELVVLILAHPRPAQRPQAAQTATILWLSSVMARKRSGRIMPAGTRERSRMSDSAQTPSTSSGF